MYKLKFFDQEFGKKLIKRPNRLWKFREEEFANNILFYLNDNDWIENLCDNCPATVSKVRTSYCKRCHAFIGLTHDGVNPYDNGSTNCPCHILGEDTAAEEAWAALEEKGYLDI